jgi:prophage regulatory protein
MPDNSNPIGTLPETGYVRQFQLIPVIFPFSSATLWRKVKAGTFPQPANCAQGSRPGGSKTSAP